VVDLEFSLHSFLCKNKGGGRGGNRHAQ